MSERSPLSPDRFFSAEPAQRKIARQLYDSVLNLPILCPSFNRRAWTDPGQERSAPDPCELLILSDDFLFCRLSALGINLQVDPDGDGANKGLHHREIWQALADNLFTLRGQPVDIWLSEILFSVFNIRERLNGKNAQRIYDMLSASLSQPEFQFPRLIDRFNIECLGILESPTNPAIDFTRSNLGGSKTIPCFDPDPLFWVHSPDWCDQIDQLSKACQIQITDYGSFLRALQKQRLFFKSLGATTVVQSVFTGASPQCTPSDLDQIFLRAIHQQANLNDARQFSNHLLLEMASMSIEDNLVLQVHLRQVGAADSSRCVLLTLTDLMDSSGFSAMIEKFGQDRRLSIILSADEIDIGDGLKALSDHVPSLRIGSPRWIFNSLGSLQNYFDTHIEAIGLHKSAGFNNTFSSFLSLPSQNDIWRRSSANWLAKLVVHGLLDLDSAYEMIYALAYGLVKSAYRL
jgi:glucuronate isomerase